MAPTIAEKVQYLRPLTCGGFVHMVVAQIGGRGHISLYGGARVHLYPGLAIRHIETTNEEEDYMRKIVFENPLQICSVL